MKKLLLLCAMVIVCVLLLPQGVMADQLTQTTTLDANPTATITLTVASVPSTWTLSSASGLGGSNQLTGGTVAVASNTAWTVNAQDFAATTGNLGTKTAADKGYLANYTTGSFVASPLNTRIAHQPQVAVTGGSTVTDLAAGGSVLTGNGDTSSPKALVFDVVTTTADMRLPATTNSYHMDVLFTAASNF
jgi:hypothetical protein